MSEFPMRGHFRYLRFKTFLMTPRTPQCEVFCPLLSSSEHSGVPEDSQPPTFPSVGLHPHTWPKWGCDIVEANGVGTQDEYFVPSPNRWANRKGQLGDPTIPKELCSGESTRLGGPFGVSRILLQQLGTLHNGVHSIPNGDGKVTNCAHDLGITRTNSK